MRQLIDYDIFIFDCDGVILNTNQLKIEAMKNTLKLFSINKEQVSECINYFRLNFGKSRFHHVKYFVDNILHIDEKEKTKLEMNLLEDFSKQCRSLYLTAELTPGFISFLQQCQGKRYVASGSDQTELREVFIQRGLDVYFDAIFGSPTTKTELIEKILKIEKNSNAVMFGDAESDMISAEKNNINFVFYSPFSNVKEKMGQTCNLNGYLVIDDFSIYRF